MQKELPAPAPTTASLGWCLPGQVTPHPRGDGTKNQRAQQGCTAHLPVSFHIHKTEG